MDNVNQWTVQGTINSAAGQIFLLRVDRCVGSDCASEEEYEEFERTYNLAIINNQVEYLPSEYGEETLKRSVTFPRSYKLNRRQGLLYGLRQNKVSSKESYVGFSFFSNNVYEETFYSLEQELIYTS